MLGGGKFTSQNKKLPGTYINFIGTPSAKGLSDRGTSAVALSMPWGELGKLVSVSKEHVYKACKRLFGCSYTDDAMLPLREMFCHAEKVLVYRLGTGGEKAGNTFADAKYEGTAGNKIIITITATTDGEDQTGWVVKTYFGDEVVDEQTAGTTDKTTVLKANDFVTWKSDVALAATTKTTGAMTGGADPTAPTSHGEFLKAIQTKNFQTVACSSTSTTIIAEYEALVEQMRDAYGIMCQAIVYNRDNSNFEGIINAVNNINGEAVPSGNVVYWVAGAEAGCAVNKSCTNMTYDGELDINTDYTQEDLEEALDNGRFIMHMVDDEVKVLEDINSLTKFTEAKTEDFRYNQTIRVLDQFANDVTTMFNKEFIGISPNNVAGRESLWSRICNIGNALQDLQALEDFDTSDIEVSIGEDKRKVVCNAYLKPVNAMSQLYVSVYVS